MLLIRRSDDFSGRRPTGIHEPLELGIGDNIFVNIVSEQITCRRRIFYTGSDHNAFNLKTDVLVRLPQDNGIFTFLLTGLDTQGDRTFATLAAIHSAASDAGPFFAHLAKPATRIHFHDIGDCLGKSHGNQLTLSADFTVHFIWNTYRAGLYTGPAPGTFFLVNIQRLSGQLDFKGTVGFFDLANLGVGQNFYIFMIVDLVHLRSFDADGTIIGRKGLVQSGHHAADAGGIVDHIDFSSILGSIHGAANSGNSATNHQY